MRHFIAKDKNNAFICFNCGGNVPPLVSGGCRNHCPFCLYSLHVDITPGDRASLCKGVLEPINIDHSPKKGWVIIYKCKNCGVVKRNKAALDDNSCPDSYEEILRLSANQTI